MNPNVAIIALDFEPVLVEMLKTALQADGARCTICPEADRRAALRWTMDLEPEKCNLCVICDNDGPKIAFFSTALDPKIPALAWCPGAANPEQLPAVMADAPCLVSFAKSAEVIAQTARPLLYSTTSAPKANLERRPLAPATAPALSAEEPHRSVSADDEDAAVYEQLETMMAAPVKEVPKQAPVQIQKPALDFSNPLRRLMSQGHSLAQKNSSTEVLGAHYLAALEEPYTTELEHVGLTRQLINDYLSGFASGEDIATEPVVSDEAFEAVSKAKARARETEKTCIRTADFLLALLAQTEGSVADIVSDGEISRESLHSAIAAMDEIEEPCASAFFAPSSLDQESFYQFDPAQVRNIEERLRNLPGFQKAAARVAEARTAQATTGAGLASHTTTESPRPQTPTAAEPPEKPEILKVSADFPSVDAVEHIADRLLEGQLIGFPADTMYALAVDAANPAAIERLRDAANLPQDKPLSILINSTTQLKHLVRADLDALEPLFDELWPGPLTLVFKAAGSIARHVSTGGTVAIRQPGDNTSLAILSMLGRPLAVTSWNDALPQQPVDTNKLTEQLAGQAAIIVTHGEPTPQTRTTIVDLTASPWQILREGATPGQSVLRHMPRA